MSCRRRAVVSLMRRAFAMLKARKLSEREKIDHWIELCRQYYVQNPSAPRPRIDDVLPALEPPRRVGAGHVVDFWEILQAAHHVVNEWRSRGRLPAR